MKNGATVGKAAAVVSAVALMAGFVYWRAIGSPPLFSVGSRAEPAPFANPMLVDDGSATWARSAQPVATLYRPPPDPIGALPPGSLDPSALLSIRLTEPSIASRPTQMPTSKSGAIAQPGDVLRMTVSQAATSPPQLMAGSKSAVVVTPQALMGSSKYTLIGSPGTFTASSGTLPTGTVTTTTGTLPLQPGTLMSSSKIGRVVEPSMVFTTSLIAPNGTALVFIGTPTTQPAPATKPTTRPAL